MLDLESAIKHCEEVAEEQDKLCKRYDGASGYTRSHNEKIRTTDAISCEKCAEEHRQLAEWLKELKDYRERMPSYEAGYNEAKREIALSGEYERAYQRGASDVKVKIQSLIDEDIDNLNKEDLEELLHEIKRTVRKC